MVNLVGKGSRLFWIDARNVSAERFDHVLKGIEVVVEDNDFVVGVFFFDNAARSLLYRSRRGRCGLDIECYRRVHGLDLSDAVCKTAAGLLLSISLRPVGRSGKPPFFCCSSRTGFRKSRTNNYMEC